MARKPLPPASRLAGALQESWELGTPFVTDASLTPSRTTIDWERWAEALMPTVTEICQEPRR